MKPFAGGGRSTANRKTAAWSSGSSTSAARSSRRRPGAAGRRVVQRPIVVEVLDAHVRTQHLRRGVGQQVAEEEPLDARRPAEVVAVPVEHLVHPQRRARGELEPELAGVVHEALYGGVELRVQALGGVGLGSERRAGTRGAIHGKMDPRLPHGPDDPVLDVVLGARRARDAAVLLRERSGRSEEHTSELQSLAYLVCRLLLEKKKQ